MTRAIEAQIGEAEGLALPSPLETSFSSVDEHLIVTSDGKGGVFVHMDRMRRGQPYTIVVDDTPLVAMKQNGDVILYGFPE